MKTYRVIHHSDNWCFSPSIPGFKTLKEAEKYIKDFRGEHHHRADTAEIVEVISTHKAAAVDNTEKGPLYGFWEQK